MDREKAILLLKRSAQEAAMDKSKSGKMASQAFDMGAAALCAQQALLDPSQWKGCCECSSKVCASCLFDWVDDDEEPCCECAGGSEYQPNEFCSNCGRPLTEEAWETLEKRGTQTETSNPPLSQDELQEYVVDLDGGGKPLWILEQKGKDCPIIIEGEYWALVTDVCTDGICTINGFGNKKTFYFEDYKKDWLAYLRKPAEGRRQP